MIRIEDIAHAGSQLCRFTGHIKFHYSIAQHELLGSYLVPEEFALEFLLHDAAESYVNDMSRPLKHLTKCGDLYRPIENRIQALIRKKFGLPKTQSLIIHEIDNAMLWAEKEQLMPSIPWPETEVVMCQAKGNAAEITIFEYLPRFIKRKFLQRFDNLTI